MDVDLSTGLVIVHVIIGVVFIGLGVQNYLAGRPVGLVLQGLMGVLIIGLGVGTSRLVGASGGD